MSETHSTPVAAKAACVSHRQAMHWASTGLVVPTHDTTGRGEHRKWTLRDVVALAVVGELRRLRVSTQRCRNVQAELRDYGHTFASARLVVLDPARSGSDVRPRDVLLVENERALLSLLETPGQYVVRAAIPLGAIEQVTRKRLRSAEREDARTRKRAKKDARGNA